jgi:hypothetical protein
VTDPQLAVIASTVAAAVGGLTAALRWAVNRVTASNDAGTKALIDNTASNAVLGTKVDALMISNQRLADRIDGIGDFVEEHTPIGPVPRMRTPARGVAPIGGIRSPRRGTHHDGED